MTEMIEEIVLDTALPVGRKALEINHRLHSLPDHGFQVALDTLGRTRDPRVASFAGNHLALFPGHEAEKRAVSGEILDCRQEVVIGITNLVRFLDPPMVERIIGEYVRQPAGEFYNLAYEVATWFPAQLREHFPQIPDSVLRLGMLSGGPDNWAETVAAQYLIKPSPSHLQTLGRFHTAGAIAELRRLLPQVPQSQHDVWVSALHADGQSHKSARPVVIQPALSGFVADAGQSPHLIGDFTAGIVPQCVECGKAGYRLLRLSARDLSFALAGGTDPEFFWLSCGCKPPPFVNMEISGHSRRALIGPQAKVPAGPLPQPASLVLTPHPNPTGIALDASSGLGRHQVGGFPQWIRPDLFPVCLHCHETMRFIAQLDDGMSPLGPLKLGGIVYCFWCESCRTSTTMLQQD